MSATKGSRLPESLSLAQQNYVEAIADLCRTGGSARTSELAALLHVRMPSVSEAVTRLVEEGVVLRTEQHRIELSPKGVAIASQLKQRHEALLLFMTEVMAMDKPRADAMACKIEHCVDKAFSDRILILAEFLERKHPETLKAIATHFRKRAKEPSTEWSQFSI
jgi:DtxR family Mn-dependent transcriptional regulator